MKYSCVIGFLLFVQYAFSQISGTVTDANGTAIAYALLFVENSSLYTISNANGQYSFPQTISSDDIIWCQHLDYFSKNYPVRAHSKQKIDFVLDDRLGHQIIVNSNELGKNIIKKAIRFRKNNHRIFYNYSYDFYSKGAMEVTNFPQKIIGYDIQQLDPNLKLDSLRNQYIFLSENISKVEGQKPFDYKESILSSKTSGNNQGLNFETSYHSQFDFYNNEAYTHWRLISPIASNAFNYYQYQLVDQWLDTYTNQTIYKIKVTPIRNEEPVVDGFLFIAEKNWEIYGVDFTVKGANVESPQVQEYHIRQQYVYNKEVNQFVKSNQSICFAGKILVFDFISEYQQVYTNWRFDSIYSKKYFSKEWIQYASTTETTDSIYTQKNRPLALTYLEKIDFVKHDRELLDKSTKQYQDSVDKVNNRFNLFKLIVGYKYRNSYKNETYKYNGLLSTFAFNAVQGFNVTTGLSYLKEQPHRETYYELGGFVNYGIAENKPRFSGYYTQLFNRYNYAKLDISGGVVVHQFGEEFPIKKLINSIASSYFGRNYAKFYKKEYIRTAYEQEVINGLFARADFEYSNRVPLYNHTTNSPFVKDKLFGSNNPLDPTDFENAGFTSNHIFKLRLKATYHIGQKFIRYPHKKIHIRNRKYPSLTLEYENGFGSTDAKNNYNLLSLSTKYETSLGIVGNLGMYINAGKFFNADEISFMDYKHFYGNETFVGTSQNYLGKFNLLPYYSYSTNKDFVEWHVEHNFKGFLLNKVPVIRKLQYHFIAGAHGIQTLDKNPYFEYSIGLENFGIGTFRPFRIDYFRSYFGGQSQNGFIIGIKLLDKLN